jgi:hypothetical protein
VALKKSFPLNYRGKCVRKCRNKWTYAIINPSLAAQRIPFRLIQASAIDKKLTIWEFTIPHSAIGKFPFIPKPNPRIAYSTGLSQSDSAMPPTSGGSQIARSKDLHPRQVDDYRHLVAGFRPGISLTDYFQARFRVCATLLTA